MSRSNPHDSLQNPSTRWFEWNGEKGQIRYYDKAAKQRVDVELPFTFLLLDQLATVGGWHDPSSSGIYANEVRDTRQDVLIVKAFKEGTLAEGLYKDIKDRVNSEGGYFVASCYIAYKDGADLALGAIRFKGAALGSWMEFTKAHRSALYDQAIIITGFTDGKKGRVVFKMPTFALKPVSDATNAVAKDYDQTLQTYLENYLKRTKRDQVAQAPAHVRDEDVEPPPPDYDTSPVSDSDLEPF